MPQANWDEYINKHQVRLQGWLPAAKDFVTHIEKGNLKYLTLCDVQAIDIFMFEKEELLIRDTKKELHNVTIVESDAAKIEDILRVTRPPLHEAVIIGKIEKLLLVDKSQYEDIDLDEDVVSKKKRKEREQAKIALKLQSLFPFHIINFDPWSNLFNPNKELHRGFKEIFNLQQGIYSFLLFITSVANPENIEPIKETFEQDFEENINNHVEIKNKAEEQLNTHELKEINDSNKQIHIGFNKSFIAKYAKEFGWKAEFLGTYFYENQDNRQNISIVVRLDKNENNQEDWYIEQIQKLIEQEPMFFPYEESENNQETKEHLESIINFRESLQNKFRD